MTLPAPDSQVPPAGAARAEPTHQDPRDPQGHGASAGSRVAGLLGPTEVRGLSQALGIRPTKTLGQNFVHDAGTVRRIVRSAGVRPEDTVLEIGPGLGSLTLALLEAGARVIAVEIDPALARALPVTVADRMPQAAGHLTLIQADALSITGPDSLGEAGPPPTRLVANLPYNVAVPVLLTVLEIGPGLGSLTLALLETGARVIAVEIDPAQGLGPSDAQRVGLDDAEAVGGLGHAVGDGDGQGPGEGGIDLDGDDARPGLQQRQGEGAQARADLQDGVIGQNTGAPDDAAHGAGVMDEVLAQRLGGADAQRPGQAPDLGGSQEAGGSGARGRGRVLVPGAPGVFRDEVRAGGVGWGLRGGLAGSCRARPVRSGASCRGHL